VFADLLESNMAELVRVKITATVITSRYGALGPGDFLRTDAAYAKHLVEECSAAKYVTTPTPQKQVTEKPPATLTQKAMNLLRGGGSKK
jgi:hypothetical protein